MTEKNKITFTTKDAAGKEISLDVRKPTSKTLIEANRVWNKSFVRAIADGAYVRAKLQSVAEAQGIWDDDKQSKLDAIDKEIEAGENALAAGGIKKSKGRAIAIKLRKDRARRSNLLTDRNALDNASCESQAENRQFDCLVALSTLDSETGDPYFKNLDDYDGRKDEQAAVDAATNLAFLVYQVDPEYLQKYPENKFLNEYGFSDDKHRLVDSQGRLCDEDYRLLDENSRYINDQGEFIDIDGNRVNEDGTPFVEFSAFLDD